MVHIAICDDEEFYISKITALINEYFARLHNETDDVSIEYQIDTYLNGLDILDAYHKKKEYQILFLDINLNDMNGIKIAKKIREYSKETYIVFVSAFLDYAVEGYEVNAVRYLLKDKMDSMFLECMDAIRKKMIKSAKLISCMFREGVKKVNVDTICYIASEKHRLYFYINEQEELVEYSIYDKLDTYDTKLKMYGFIRIHKSYLVNVKYIKRISNYFAILTNGIEVPIPKSKYQIVKEEYFRIKGEF